MNEPKLEIVSLPKLGYVKRKGITVSQEGPIKVGCLPCGKSIPLVVQPAVDGVNLVDWASSNRDFIETLLLKHRALLFRNFNVKALVEFEQFVKATSNGELLEYRDRSTPRTTQGNRIYTSTVHPADQRINLHNEGTYWLKWPSKIYFCCLSVSQQGGETPIADVRKVYQRIHPEIRDQFIEKKMMLVRNYNDGFGLTWQDVYQTNDRTEVEKYCRNNLIEFEWKDGERLRTHQIRPAVQKHPQTGELLWFNHAAFFHYTTLEANIREVLLSEFNEDGLPYNTYYGDGTAIKPTDIEHICQAYEQEKVVFTWLQGDILMLDNMSIAHGREAYIGERQVIVAMSEPFIGSDNL
ncbi:MAG: TauD/TfdA family dioxygenase [Rhizonema sp. NSF051]|nr:TauD/TfdA family dioxygenase [Rhizonema sp. NSF051]